MGKRGSGGRLGTDSYRKFNQYKKKLTGARGCGCWKRPAAFRRFASIYENKNGDVLVTAGVGRVCWSVGVCRSWGVGEESQSGGKCTATTQFPQPLARFTDHLEDGTSVRDGGGAIGDVWEWREVMRRFI